MEREDEREDGRADGREGPAGWPPVPAEEILARADLLSGPDGRGGAGTPPGREGWVDVVRPFVYPIAPDELPPSLRGRATTLGTRYVGALFAADLGELPRGGGYGKVELTVRLDDRDGRAVGLAADASVLELVDLGGAGQVVPAPVGTQRLAAARPARLSRLSWPSTGRTSARPSSASSAAASAVPLPSSVGRHPGETVEPEPEVRCRGLLSGSFTWSFRSGLTAGAGRGLVGHATLELPPASSRLTGHIAVDATISRSTGRFRRTVDTYARDVAFDEPLGAADPGPGPGEAERPPGPSRPVDRPVRLVISADVKGYSAHEVAQAEWLQDRLARVMAAARAATGVVGVQPQPQGDCLVLVFPPGSDDVVVLPAFLSALADAVRAANRGRDLALALRIRVGVARGSTGVAATGWSGQAPIAASRLRDSEPAREAMREAGAALVVVASDEIHQDVLAREWAGPPFRRVEVRNQEKGFDAAAWLLVSA